MSTARSNGALRAGVPTPIAFAITPLVAQSAGFSSSGPATTLAERTYTTVLAPGASSSDRIAITPPAAGDAFQLEFTIDYADDIQPLHGSRTYVTPISP